MNKFTEYFLEEFADKLEDISNRGCIKVIEYCDAVEIYNKYGYHIGLIIEEVIGDRGTDTLDLVSNVEINVTTPDEFKQALVYIAADYIVKLNKENKLKQLLLTKYEEIIKISNNAIKEAIDNSQMIIEYYKKS